MFDFTGLALYKIIFTIELLIAMHMFLCNTKKKDNYVIRYILSIFACLVVALLFPVAWDFCYTWWYSSLMFLLLFIVCVFSLTFVYQINWQKLFFNSITAYTAQHLAYQIYNAIINICDVKDLILSNCYTNEEVQFVDAQMNILFFCIMIVIYALVYFAIYSLFIRRTNGKSNDKNINNFYLVGISMVILLVDIIFNSIHIYSNPNASLVTSLLICAYNSLCCLLVIFVLYGVLENKNLHYEMDMISQLLNKKEEQYERNRDNIEQINIKIHDLKHQIREYASNGKISPVVVEDLNNLIEIYDSQIKSGNQVFDLIVSEQKMRCQKQNISLKCYADCSKLDFISDVDCYSLFGNMFDNAIEASEKILDVDRRKIHIMVMNNNAFVSIRMENYYDGTIEMTEDGFIETTKDNSRFHGYGLKSIKLIVEKYNGNITFQTDNNIFVISIMFPIA